MSNNIPWQSILEEAELDALAWKTMGRVKDGETLPTGGVYRRMMSMLQAKAKELENEANPAIETVHDWLALALFAKDRQQFVRMCQQADQQDDPLYRRAEHWLKKFIENEQNLTAGGGA